VAPAVFNTDVVEQLDQAGSIPVRLRQPATELRLEGTACGAGMTVRSRFRSVGSPAVPDSDNDIENRVAVLERQILQLNEQVALPTSEAAAARVLAAGADHSLGDKVTQGFDTLGTGMAQIMALLTPNSSSERS
jgi:hypothetical protein